jgi:glycosyltransferase involved in cell wall biosynthesis
LHCHDYKTLIIGKAIKEIKKETKIIYDSHEFLSGWPWYKEIQTLKGKIKGRFVWKKFNKLEKEAISYCNSILTVSETLADEINEKFKLSDKPKVLRNIPEAINIEPNNYFRELYQLDGNSTIIIHSGNIYHSNKRIKNLLNVFIELQKENIHLVFIGDSKKLKIISENTKEKNIHFHHYPNRKELYRIIQSADFGLVYTWQPNWKSHWYSLPNRILEYTLAQLPIISTSQPEFIKISQRYNHLLLFKGNSKKELKNAILSAKGKREILKNKSILASQDLSWEKEIETLVKLYQENTHA